MAENGVRMLCQGVNAMGNTCRHDNMCTAYSGKVFPSVNRQTPEEARREQRQARGEHRHSAYATCFNRACNYAPERIGEHVRCRCVAAPMDVDNYCGICGFPVRADWEWELLTGKGADLLDAESAGFVETTENNVCNNEMHGSSSVYFCPGCGMESPDSPYVEDITSESTVTIIASVTDGEKVRVSGVREDSIAYEMRKYVPTLTFEFAQDDSMGIGYIPGIRWYRTQAE